jgi:hypothetical protein
MLFVWWTVSPHCHVEDFSAGLHIVRIWTGGHRHGVYGDIGDVVTHCSLGDESYYVLRDTFYFSQLAPHQHRSTPLLSEEPGKLW